MPTGHFRHYIEHYLAPHPSSEVREVFVSTAILNFAVAAVMLFEPLYLRAAGFSLSQIILFYLALYVLYFFALPLGGRICRARGYEHSILYSSPFLILYYVSLFAIPYHEAFIPLALVFLVIQKILYWPGYHANLATWGGRGERGREVSNISALVAVTASLAPAFGGLVVAYFGYQTLFIIVSILILVSNIPLLRTPEHFEPAPFPYGKAVARVFRPERRRRLAGFMGYGEELIALALWPLFIALLMPGTVAFGLVMSFAMFVTVAVALYVGRAADENGNSAVLRTGVVYGVGSWLIRPLVGGSFGIFLADAYYRVTKNAIGIPLVAMTYDDAARGAVVEEVIFFEMALAVGKVLAAAACLAAVAAFAEPWNAFFMIAAAFTVLYALVREQ